MRNSLHGKQHPVFQRVAASLRLRAASCQPPKRLGDLQIDDMWSVYVLASAERSNFDFDASLGSQQ